MLDLQPLITNLAFGESPRWHDRRLWVADWGAQEVLAVDLEGNKEVVLRVSFPSFPMCIDWLPDGRLLVVSASEGLLLRREHDGSLVTHADLTGLSAHRWNEVVVDGRTGALAPARDDACLAEHCLRLAADPGLRVEMGRHGRERAAELFAEPQMHAGYRQLYEEMLCAS